MQLIYRITIRTRWPNLYTTTMMTMMIISTTTTTGGTMYSTTSAEKKKKKKHEELVNRVHQNTIRKPHPLLEAWHGIRGVPPRKETQIICIDICKCKLLMI